MRNQIVALALALITVSPALADDTPEVDPARPDWLVTLGSRSEVWGSLDLEGLLGGFGRHGATVGVERRVLPFLWVGADMGGSVYTAKSATTDLFEQNGTLDSEHSSASVTGGLLLRPELELNRWLAVSLPVSVRPRWTQSVAKADIDPSLLDPFQGGKSESYSAGVRATVGVAFDLILADHVRMRGGADVAGLGADYVSSDWSDTLSEGWSTSGGACLIPTLTLAAAF